MPKINVETSQNVVLEYELANIGVRIFGALIDLIVVIAYFLLMGWAMSEWFGVDLFGGFSISDLLFYLLIYFPVVFYIPVCEYFLNGKTVGKLLLRSRIIKLDGSKATVGDYILRWLIRTIDVKVGFLFIFFIPKQAETFDQYILIRMAILFLTIPFPIVGVISMLANKNVQRLGDIVANTVVIKERKRVTLESAFLKVNVMDYKPRFTNVLVLKDKDIRIIIETIDAYYKSGKSESLRRLAQIAKEKLEIKEDIKPLILLQVIIKDYNYLAGKEAEV